MEGERARTARQIWHAFARRDAEAIVALGGERAEWRPARAPEGLQGRAALEAYFEGLERAGVVEEAIAHRVEEFGRVVVITGAVREQRGGSGYVEATRSWICVFQEDTIAWGASCAGAGEISSTLAALGAA